MKKEEKAQSDSLARTLADLLLEAEAEDRAKAEQGQTADEDGRVLH